MIAYMLLETSFTAVDVNIPKSIPSPARSSGHTPPCDAFASRVAQLLGLEALFDPEFEVPADRRVLARERVHLLRRELHHLRRWGSGFRVFAEPAPR